MPSPKVQVSSFSIEQGLSNRNVNYFSKDKQGFLWVATFDGLNRFDGYSFLNYDCRPRNKHKIRYTKTYAVWPDRAGNLLVGYESSQDGLMDLLNPLTGQLDTFTFRPDERFQGKFSAFFQASDGALYFLTSEGLRAVIFQYDETAKRFSQVLEMPSSRLVETSNLQFLKAADGSFWAVYYWRENGRVELVHTDADGRLLHVYSQEKLLLPAIDPNTNPLGLIEAQKGKIWLTLPGQSVYVFDPAESAVFKPHPLLPKGGYCFAQDKMGNLLAFQPSPANRSEGCFLVTAEGNVVNYSWVFEHQSIIDQVFGDDFTQGFMAGSGDGFNLYQLRPERFKTFLNKELGDEPYGISIRGISKLGHDRMLIATERDGIYELNLLSNALTRLGDRSPQLEQLNRFQFPRNLLAQGDSVVWISGLGGVTKYVPSSNALDFYATSHVSGASGSNEVWGIAFSKNGDLLTIMRGGRLLLLDPKTGHISTYQNADGSQPLDGSRPSFILSSRDGTVWVGTMAAGLIKINLDKRETQRFTADLNDPAGFDSNHITCIHEDEAGLLWVGTMEGGLHVFDPRSGRVTAIYSRQNGLRNNSVVGILPDGKGNYWVSTFNGLAYFDTKLKTFRNFTTADGLPHNEFNRFSYFLDQNEHRFYFGGMNGVVTFDQDDLHSADSNAPLLVSEMSVTGQDGQTIIQQEGIVNGATITLEPGSRLLQLRLALGTYLDPNGNQFAYKIEGLDKDWNYLGTNRDLRIDQLPTGAYTLRLRGADNRGNWSRQEIALQLIVQQFWYKRWWAYLLYAALVAASGWYFYRFQLRRRMAEKESQRLQQLDAFKTRFFTNISHEFRTPLTVILGMVDSLKKHFDKKAAPEHEQAAELIRRNSRNLLNLVNQLLDLARLESGKLHLSPANGDLAAFLSYQLESFQSYAETRRIGLHFHSDVPHLEMAFDHEKVQAILVNLISNAIKFTPEGGRVSVELRMENGEWSAQQPSILHSPFSIVVSDTGIGIPEEQLGRVFDRFYQVDDTMTRRGEGTGIGLALVQELVKLMQGTITAESQLGQGTSFRVSLPYTPPLPELQPLAISIASGEMTFPDENLSVKNASEDDQRPLLLIVEDNPDVRFYIAECVRQEYRVATAGNGTEGIQKAMEMVPDIIISDVMMPEKDGFELCETLKNDPITSHVPIVLLTARADFESRIAGLRRGADDYLAKPFEPVELQVRLENLVKLRRRLQQRYAAMLFQPEVSDDPALVLEDVFLLKIRDVVVARLSQTDFDMPQLEQALGMSRSQVFRKVKALTGASPSVLVRNIRLNKAKELLRDHSLTIAEIAYDVGFSTPAYFSTTFLEAFGKTPSEWRQGG